MADGGAELDAIIATIEGIPGLTRSAAPDVAAAVRLELEKQIARGVGPDGVAWPVRKDTGERTLRHAADELTVTPVGNRIFLRLKGAAARHHRGRARGGIVRAVLPVSSKLPKWIADAVKRELTKAFNARIGAR